MGWPYEVLAWTRFDTEGGGYFYEDVPVYQGRSLVKAIMAARKAKKTSGCVRLEWR